MENILSRDFAVSAAQGNAEGELAVTWLASAMIEIATTHANALGIGNPAVEGEAAGWVLARLTLEMKRWPRVLETFRLSTWIESWNRHFSERCFELADAEGEVLGHGRSVWMMMDRATHANYGLDRLPFSPGMISDKVCPILRQERHTRLDNPQTALYTFRYTDIDYYRHVNTLRYIQLLLNQFPMSVYDDNFVERFEIAFMHECYFGEEATIASCTTGLLTEFNIHTPRATAVRARIRLRPRS